MAVERSFQSKTDNIVSAPITIPYFWFPAESIFIAVDKANTNPAQAALISNANAWLAPIAPWTFAAQEGLIVSGVIVATMTNSISSGFIADSPKSFWAAFIAKSLVVSSLA